MGFRITTGMMMNTYRYNLQNSTQKRTDSSEKVLTHRNFNSYVEDPAAATQAFRLRRDWYQTQNQINNTKDVYSKFNTAHQNVQGMLDDLINPMEKMSVIRAEQDTTAEARQALAQILRSTSESMIQGFNQQLGDHFIFAGNDGLNVPFEWKGETLYYRGIDVTSGGQSKPTAAEPDCLKDRIAAIESAMASPTISDADKEAYEKELEWCKYFNRETDVRPENEDIGKNQLAIFEANAKAAGVSDSEIEGWTKYYTRQTDEKPTADVPAWATDDPDKMDKYGVPKDMPVASADPVEQGWIDYYTDQGDLAKLKEMSEEEMYIDLGMGAKENEPNDPVRGSYFNSALSGLNYTNYGVDDDGDPKNFAILMRELADILDTWNEDTQCYDPDLAKNSAKGMTTEEMGDKAMRLMDKLKAAQEELTADHVELNAKASYLQTNQSRLELQSTELNTDILDVEQVDLADAITSFSWDMYCYNAALKIGNQLLSQSLIDYMR